MRVSVENHVVALGVLQLTIEVGGYVRLQAMASAREQFIKSMGT